MAQKLSFFSGQQKCFKINLKTRLFLDYFDKLDR